MPDLGISVLFKGKNMIRLLGGLWVALRISLISVHSARHRHDMEESGDKSSDKSVSGDCPHHAADGTAVSRVFRNDADVWLEFIGGVCIGNRIYILGNRRDGRSGARRVNQYPEAPV